MTPRQVLERWIEAFNRADADALAVLYAVDAVNHQVVRDPVAGRAAIREMFRAEFAADRTRPHRWINDSGESGRQRQAVYGRYDE